MSSPKRMTEVEEDDEEMLRRAALKTMSRFKDKVSATESTGRLQQNMRTTNALKNNNKLYYNNSHRNGSKRSNLIVLTKTDSELSNSQINSQSNHFTKIMERTSEVSEKRKRVLPGRFSRLERDDDSDEDTDECSDDFSDDKQMTANCAFNHTSDEQSLVFNVSQNLENEESEQIESIEVNNDSKVHNVSLNTDIKDSTNGSINEKPKSLTTNSTSSDPINNNGSDLERKETIKLNSNKISKSEAFERRKQKFGQTSHSSTQEKVNSNTDSSSTRSHRSSVKNRLSLKSNDKQKNSNKTERNYKKSVSEKEVIVSHRHHPNSRTDAKNSIDESDDCQHSKKKLRSLVVMK